MLVSTLTQYRVYELFCQYPLSLYISVFSFLICAGSLFHLSVSVGKSHLISDQWRDRRVRGRLIEDIEGAQVRGDGGLGDRVGDRPVVESRSTDRGDVLVADAGTLVVEGAREGDQGGHRLVDAGRRVGSGRSVRHSGRALAPGLRASPGRRVIARTGWSPGGSRRAGRGGANSPPGRARRRRRPAAPRGKRPGPCTR
jgi:hypothetical protein